MALERALSAFMLGARFALGGLADAMGEAIGRGERLVLIAAARRRSVGAMIAEIDAARDGANLSSAIRVYVLENSPQ